MWVDGALWLVDIERHALIRVDADGTPTTHDAGQRIGFAVPTIRGDWIAGLQNGLARWRPGSAAPVIVHDPEPDRPDNRFNDGKADPAGRLYAGTLKLSCDEPAGALYRVDTDLSVRRVRDRVTISNGLAWDADRGAMYYIDTPTQRIDRYRWEAVTGELTRPEPLVELDPGLGHPDGMTIDADGALWVAMWGGGAVLRIDAATGEIVERIEVDAPHVTSCCFGGDGLGTLFITTARIGLTPKQLDTSPRSGDVFRIEPGVAGLAVDRFAG